MTLGAVIGWELDKIMDTIIVVMKTSPADSEKPFSIRRMKHSQSMTIKGKFWNIFFYPGEGCNSEDHRLEMIANGVMLDGFQEWEKPFRHQSITWLRHAITSGSVFWVCLVCRTSGVPQSHCSPFSSMPLPHLATPTTSDGEGWFFRHIPPPRRTSLSKSCPLHVLKLVEPLKGKGQTWQETYMYTHVLYTPLFPQKSFHSLLRSKGNYETTWRPCNPTTLLKPVVMKFIQYRVPAPPGRVAYLTSSLLS